MRAKSAQSHKKKPLMAAKISIKRLVMVVPYEIIVHNESGIFLVQQRLSPGPLAKGGYFTQFCLAVMTNQIKAFLLTSTSLNGQTRRPASIQIAPSRYLPAPLPARG